MYGGSGASGVPMLPPQHPSAGYPAHPELQQSRLPQLSASASGHPQGYYPLDGCRRTGSQRALSSFTDSEDEDGSIGSPASPAHDLSKSRHGELHSFQSLPLTFFFIFMKKIVSVRETKANGLSLGIIVYNTINDKRICGLFTKLGLANNLFLGIIVCNKNNITREFAAG